MDHAKLLDAALALPKKVRADLALQLLQSLKPPHVLSEDDPGFAKELDRRMEAYESGETSATSWDAVAKRLRS